MHNFHNHITTYNINQQNPLIIHIIFNNVVNSTMFPFTMFLYTMFPITIPICYIPVCQFQHGSRHNKTHDTARLTTRHNSRHPHPWFSFVMFPFTSFGTTHDITQLKTNLSPGSHSLCSHSPTLALLTT